MFRYIAIACLLLAAPSWAAADDALLVAFGEADITPDVNAAPVWIAGYGQNRRATGVHDPLLARAVVLRHGEQKVALAAVDLVGLQYPEVEQIRARLDDFTYCTVSSTHNHEGPDTIGLWGPNPLTGGVDPEYMSLVVERVADLVRRLDGECVPANVEYGTAQNDTLLGDSRKPQVYDGVLRLLRFTRIDNGRNLGLLVQWNCHPESMGSKNTLLTADFPAYTVETLKSRHGCPVAYFSGAVGGLMAPPDNRIQNSAGEYPQEGDFEYARLYGEAVADLADQAFEAASPIALTPLTVSAKPISVPLHNPLYQAARALGVLKREGRVWSGDAEEIGEPLTAANAAGATMAVETEVAYLRFGELHVACIPGEIYPELVYGQYQEPVEPNVDFPDAPLETPVHKLLPGEKWLLFGLANDEIGYIIPKRQWDEQAPFAYGRDKGQYGEINSVGPEVAPIIMQALENRIRGM